MPEPWRKRKECGGRKKRFSTYGYFSFNPSYDHYHYRSGQADDIILLEIITHDRRVKFLKKHDLPFVIIDRYASSTGLSYVDFDIGKGVAETIQYLHALGHRDIGFITLDPIAQEKEYVYATWALQGYEKSCQQFGLHHS